MPPNPPVLAHMTLKVICFDHLNAINFIYVKQFMPSEVDFKVITENIEFTEAACNVMSPSIIQPLWNNRTQIDNIENANDMFSA